MTPKDALKGIWHSLHCASLPSFEAVESHVVFKGPGEPLSSSFRVGAAAQVSIGLCALLAKRIGLDRNSNYSPPFEIDSRHTAAEFRSERYLRKLDSTTGRPLPPPSLWDPLSGEFSCRDGRYVRTHTNFPAHREALLKTLGIESGEATRESVAAALVKSWDAFAFEDAITDWNGGCAAAMRSPAEWAEHGQSTAVRDQPLISIVKIAGSEDVAPIPFPETTRDGPLPGIKVVELTRVIAGPVAGRCLAANGATVIKLTSPHLPAIEIADLDSGRGKINAHLHLPDQTGKLKELLGTSDVFLHSYRPGSLAARGFGSKELSRLRPGIISASLSAYGTEGPWANKRGFDSLVQTACGINHAEAEAFNELPKPRALPCQALDHASGYLLAAGIMAALRARALTGGSYEVTVSLARTAQWLAELGKVEPSGGELAFEDVEKLGLLEEVVVRRPDGGSDRILAVKQSGVPALAGTSVVAIAGTDAAAWPA